MKDLIIKDGKLVATKDESEASAIDVINEWIARNNPADGTFICIARSADVAYLMDCIQYIEKENNHGERPNPK